MAAKTELPSLPKERLLLAEEPHGKEEQACLDESLVSLFCPISQGTPMLLVDHVLHCEGHRTVTLSKVNHCSLTSLAPGNFQSYGRVEEKAPLFLSPVPLARLT